MNNSDIIILTDLEEKGLNFMLESVNLDEVFNGELYLESGNEELMESVASGLGEKLKKAWENIKAALQNLVDKVLTTLRGQVQQLSVEVDKNDDGEVRARFHSKVVKNLKTITFDPEEEYRFIDTERLLTYLKGAAKDLVKSESKFEKISGAGKMDYGTQQGASDVEDTADASTGILSQLTKTFKGDNEGAIANSCKKISKSYQKCVNIIYSDICGKAVKKQGTTPPKREILKKWKQVSGLAIKCTNFNNLVKKVG